MEKRFYWLKKPKNFYERPQIRRLGMVGQGIYERLLLLALNDDAYTIRYAGIGESLADEILFDTRLAEYGVTAEDVAKTIALCVRLGLIEADDPEKAIVLTDLETMVGSETKSAVDKRRQRGRQKDNVRKVADNVAQKKDNVHRERDRVREEKETEPDRGATRRPPQPPSLSDVVAYGKKTGSAVDPEKFFKTNESRGWRISGDPILNWQALFDTWTKTQRTPPDENMTQRDVDALLSDLAGGLAL